MRTPRRALPLAVLAGSVLFPGCLEAPREFTAARRDSLTVASGERDVVPVLPGPGNNSQVAPAAAANTSAALFAWEDTRAGTTEVFLARLAAAAGANQLVPLDPSSLRLGRSQAGGFSDHPAAATDGTGFLVAWRELGGGTALIRGQLVPPAGPPTAGPFTIGAGSGVRGRPTAGFNGSTYVIAWVDARLGVNHVFAARVTPNGVVLDPTGFRVSEPGTLDADRPTLSAAGVDGSLLVTWAQRIADGGTGLVARRIDADGGLLAAAPVALSAWGQARESASAATDAGWAVAWVAVEPGVPTLWYARLASDGTPLDDGGTLLVSDAGELGSPRAVAYVRSANEVIELAWSQGSGIMSRSVGSFDAPDLTSPATVLEPQAARPESPALATDGFTVFAGWSKDSLDRPDIWVRASLSSGATTPLTLVSAGAAAQTAGGSAASPSGFLAHFSEERLGEPRKAYVARLDTSGQPLDDAGTLVSGTAFSVVPSEVAYGAGRYLATFSCCTSAQDDVRGTLVDRDGSVLAPAAFLISGAPGMQRLPAVDFDGVNFVVAWLDNRLGSGQDDVFAARVTPQGFVVDFGGQPVRVSANAKGGHSVAGGGGGALVLWHEALDGGVPQAMVAPSPADGGTPPAPRVLWPEGFAQYAPRASFDGAAFLVVYETSRPGLEAWGVRVDVTGTPLGDAFRIAGGSGANAGGPRSVFDGTNHLVAFRTRPAEKYQVVRVSPHGQVLDATPLDVFQSDGGLLAVPRAASSGLGHTLVSFSRYVDEPAFNAPRVRAIALLSLPLGQPCGAPAECESGFCVQGVCCDEACGGGANPCLACAAAAGAVVNGACGARASPVVCRPAADECDQAELCGGSPSAVTCPPDDPAPAGTPCAAGVCSARACVAVPLDAGTGGGGGAGPSARRLAVGCGCGTGFDAAIGLALLALAGRGRHARRR